MKVRLKKLNEKAVVPIKAHESDAGFDLVATSKTFDHNGCVVYGTGLAVEIPKGHVGLLFPRSSIAKKTIWLTNSVGVIDSGYRGEIIFKFKPDAVVTNPLKLWIKVFSVFKRFFSTKIDYIYVHNNYTAYKVGERIGQLIIIPYPEIEFEEAKDLSLTDRGIGGYGSTGK